MGKEKIIIEKFGLQNMTSIQYIPGVALAKANSLQKNPVNDFNAGQAPTVDSPLYTGKFGTPVFADLEIEAGNYIDNDGNIIRYPGLIMEMVLIDISQAKITVKTPIQGAPGRVKEYISEDDWTITIKGILAGSNGVYPADDVNSLIQIAEASTALTVNSWYLSQYGIYQMYIETKSFKMQRGEYAQQVFEFIAYSDIPIELF